EFPYAQLVSENRRRGRTQPEFELFDTGLFNDDRYFDVFIEYAKESPDDLLLLVTVHNRGPVDATIHVLPQIWFRNTWSWNGNGSGKPSLTAAEKNIVRAQHAELGEFEFIAEESAELLFCENETNVRRFSGDTNAPGCFKDAFHDYVVDGRKDAVNADRTGTKAAALHVLSIPAGGKREVRVRLRKASNEAVSHADFHDIVARRREEADRFYAGLQHDFTDEDARNVQRQAFAGMIWSKQFYYYDVSEWLRGDVNQPAPPSDRRYARNSDWQHLNNADIISMPDKWEYPWYAAWDLAFHCIPLALVDAEFAKAQLVLLTREWYMHPNGQLPAYEWQFGDVNPPVHAWATWRVFQIDRKQTGGRGDLAFLERVFHKLMLNFTWWVNRKDAQGRNVFQGGFLGLDNIGVFDRSAPLPTGGFINQADGTSWMAMYCLNLMRIALELALHNPVYQDIATKFFEHFLHIAEAITNVGEDGSGPGLWDEEDKFFYDKLILPNGQMTSLKVRSMVGLIPLFAVETIEPEMLAHVPDFARRLHWFLDYRPDLARLVSRWEEPGLGERRLLSLLRGHRMKRLLKRMLDETEFLSDYGVRAMSRSHAAEPYVFRTNGQTLTVSYQPAESDSSLFGGNSNWRGPIWFPVNYLIIESLQKFHHYYGDDFKIECPTGSGNFMTISEVAAELSHRLSKIFLRDENGKRPVFGRYEKMSLDPHFRDYIHFFEYFHGDSGEGVGASHQTGWTGLIAKLLQPRRESDRECAPVSSGKSATT
ncbi:MAG: glucosidase, partial [Planctomycetaceae bacterium]